MYTFEQWQAYQQIMQLTAADREALNERAAEIRSNWPEAACRYEAEQDEISSELQAYSELYA